MRWAWPQSPCRGGQDNPLYHPLRQRCPHMRCGMPPATLWNRWHNQTWRRGLQRLPYKECQDVYPNSLNNSYSESVKSIIGVECQKYNQFLRTVEIAVFPASGFLEYPDGRYTPASPSVPCSARSRHYGRQCANVSSTTCNQKHLPQPWHLTWPEYQGACSRSLWPPSCRNPWDCGGHHP